MPYSTPLKEYAYRMHFMLQIL